MIPPFSSIPASIVKKDKTQTLTNKTLTNPVINYTDTTITMNVKARAYLSADQDDIATGSFVKVLLDTESYDVGSDFAANKFTCPVTGYYLVAFATYLHDLTDELDVYAAIHKNGTAVLEFISHGENTYGHLGGVDIIQANATDYFELYVLHSNAGATADISSGIRKTFMSVHLLSI